MSAPYSRQQDEDDLENDLGPGDYAMENLYAQMRSGEAAVTILMFLSIFSISLQFESNYVDLNDHTLMY